MYESATTGIATLITEFVKEGGVFQRLFGKGLVRGKVVNSLGFPIPGVKVILNDHEHIETTSSKGTFIFAKLKGKYIVSLSSNMGFYENFDVLYVPGGGELDITIKVEWNELSSPKTALEVVNESTFEKATSIIEWPDDEVTSPNSGYFEDETYVEAYAFDEIPQKTEPMDISDFAHFQRAKEIENLEASFQEIIRNAKGGTIPEFFREVLTFLLDKNLIEKEMLPISVGKGTKRYFISDKPIHPSKKPFFNVVEVHGLYMDSNTSWDRAIRQIGLLIDFLKSYDFSQSLHSQSKLTPVSERTEEVSSQKKRKPTDKPQVIVFPDGSEVPVKSWKQSLQVCVQYLIKYRLDPSLLPMKHSTQMEESFRGCVKIHDSLYIDTHGSAKQIRIWMKECLDKSPLYGVPIFIKGKSGEIYLI
jgi:hypothetical protein